MQQGNLFQPDPIRKEKLGQANIFYKLTSSILTPASGFMNGYDYTLNPYSGCSFGCTYCYAAFFARNTELRKHWGEWVTVKENALDLLKKQRKKPLIDKTIYISSVTDPYQPIERELNLTRELLEELASYHKPRIVIQTRSALVKRDIDLFKRFENIQVNMTITTDSEDVRKVFEPFCSNNITRMNAIKEVAAVDIPTCITMTPLLPIENIDNFITLLLETGVKKFIVQPFHVDKGRFAANTREGALKMFESMNWSKEKYNEVEKVLKQRLPNLGVGKEGFAPI